MTIVLLEGGTHDGLRIISTIGMIPPTTTTKTSLLLTPSLSIPQQQYEMVQCMTQFLTSSS
jgi:hypothetical protein